MNPTTIENIADFKILDLKVPIGINEYHDVGYVKSLEEKRKEIILNRGKIYVKRDNTENELGLCIYITQKEKKEVYIFYLDQEIQTNNKDLLLLTRYDNILIRAHEETHALDGLDKLEYLANELSEKQNVKISFDEIENQEVLASIGSIYALNKIIKEEQDWSKRLVKKEITNVLIRTVSESCKDFNQALQIYNKSKITKKKYFIF